MQLEHPLRALTPTVDADVLEVLARADATFTGREVARLVTSYSRAGVQKALGRLVAHGLVSRDQAGASHQYQLNRDHLAAPHVEALARLRDEFRSRVSALVSGWAVPAEVVILFGSAARGEMTVESDIDLFVVGPSDDEAWQEQTMDLARKVTAWTGNDGRVLQMTPDEAADVILTEPVLEAIRIEGHVLHGPRDYLERLRRQAGTEARP